MMSCSRDRRYRTAMEALAAALMVLAVVHLLAGTTSLSLSTAVRAIITIGDMDPAARILWLLRLPRILVVVMAGAMLGLSGAIMQSVTRNVLAEPGLMGVTAGTVLAIVAVRAFWPTDLGASVGWRPFIGMAGGFTAAALTYIASRRRGRLPNGSALILTGVLISTACGALTTIILLGSLEAEAADILFWTLGSTNGRTWFHVEVLAPVALIAATAGLVATRVANALQLGEGVATGLGQHVGRARLALLFIASVLTAGAVSVVGGVGFIGLMAPHIARSVSGGDARCLFPLSTMTGATLLLGADLLARFAQLGSLSSIAGLSLPGATGLPIGAVTALVGVPFFLYLAFRKGSGI